MDYTIEQIWDYLIDYNIANEDELRSITCINGYTIDSLNDVIYARTGYRDIDQFLSE